MTDIVWGGPITVNEKRPIWLKDDDILRWYRNDGKGYDWENRYYKHTNLRMLSWCGVDTIRLPADHWAYLAIAKGFEPWLGSPERKAPSDWDGGLVLRRDGDIDTVGPYPASWDHIPNYAPHRDVIGYRKKEEAVAEERDIGEHEAPEWAFARVAEYVNTDGSSYDAKGVADSSLGKAFAAYLAYYEEPPYQPDAIEIACASMADNGIYIAQDMLRDILNKRGLEIREIG